MMSINKNDFVELLPSKMSIARLFTEQISLMAKYQHSITHEQVYEEIENAHIRIFGRNMDFSSYDSFRKYLTAHRKDIFRKP